MHLQIEEVIELIQTCFLAQIGVPNLDALDTSDAQAEGHRQHRRGCLDVREALLAPAHRTHCLVFPHYLHRPHYLHYLLGHHSGMIFLGGISTWTRTSTTMKGAGTW